MSYFTLNRIGHFSSVGGSRTVPRGRVSPFSGDLIGNQAYATDSIGLFTLTLEGLVIGSAIQIQAANGTPLHNETAASATEVIVLQAYAGGSPLNDLRIKVRKGSSAPFYQPFVTQTLALKGAQSIFVSQIPDE